MILLPYFYQNTFNKSLKLLKIILFMLLLLFIVFTLKNKGSTMACYDLRNFWNFRVMIYGKKNLPKQYITAIIPEIIEYVK